MMVVVTVDVAVPMFIMRSSRVSMTVVVVMIDRVTAGIAPMRTHQCNQRGEDRAEQRQEDDGLDHAPTP